MRDDGRLRTAKGGVAVDALEQGKGGIGHRRIGLLGEAIRMTG
jgi:hypothetical protein